MKPNSDAYPFPPPPSPFFLSGDIRTLEDCSSVEELLRVIQRAISVHGQSFFYTGKVPGNISPGNICADSYPIVIPSRSEGVEDEVPHTLGYPIYPDAMPIPQFQSARRLRKTIEEIRLDRTASFFVERKFPENGADIMERNWAALTYLDDLESFVLVLVRTCSGDQNSTTDMAIDDMVPWELIDTSEAHHTTASKSNFELASALNNDMEGAVTICEFAGPTDSEDTFASKPTEPDEYTIQMDCLANYMRVNHTIVHCSQFTLHETLEETGQSAVLRSLIEELLRTLQGAKKDYGSREISLSDSRLEWKNDSEQISESARWFRRQRHGWRERDEEAVMQRPAMKQAMDVYLKFLDAFDNALGRFAER